MLVKGEVILVDIKKAEDIEQYRGKLKGNFVIAPTTTPYQVSYEPLAERYTEQQLEELEKVPVAVLRHQEGIWVTIRQCANWATR